MTQPGTTLYVLPSSRSIRERLQRQKTSNAFLDRHITMGEFLSRLVVVESARRVDGDVRNLLLLEAARFERFELLQIERSFFTFVQNSHYIFRFLEELSGEGVGIEALQRADTYGDYEEHLQVLAELYRRFGEITRREGVVDPIYLRERYRLNSEYLAAFSEIRILSVGYLTEFEMSLLQEAAQHCRVVIDFEATPYNAKMRSKFSGLGFHSGERGFYRFDIGARSSEVCRVEAGISKKIEAFGVTQRLLQVAFVKERVYAMRERGIPVEAIVVVVPDENFAQTLRAFDEERNFNFAMGTSLQQSRLYQRLKAFADVADDATLHNAARRDRLGSETFESFAEAYAGAFDPSLLRQLVEHHLQDESDTEVKRQVLEALFHFERLGVVLETLSFRQAFHIFLQRLSDIRIDDVGGGKVTVMGLLETRGVAFRGVIIVDFNEGYVPRISEKDLFLNSTIREHSGLPTGADRQDLQKHYYYQLIHAAEAVAISYVHNSESVPSRFLTQMGIEAKMCSDEVPYARILFELREHPELPDLPICEPFDFRTLPLSATMLKSYLSCRRQFYFRYVRKLNAHVITKELPEEWEIGTLLHEALRIVFETREGYGEPSALKAALEEAFAAVARHNPLVRYQLKLWREKLLPFYENEVARFAAGKRVVACESALTCKVDDITLQGRLDRIDSTPEGLEVLDYKSGTYRVDSAKQVEESREFQLEFYYLLATTLGRVAGCSYYDLNRGVCETELQLEAKLQKLHEHIAALPRGESVSFERCDDLTLCRYCDYNLLCGRA